MLLSDMGAEVLKVEIPGEGDSTRKHGPYIQGLSSYFLSVNRGKKSVTLNLKDPRGKKILLELAKKSDIVMENFRPGVMEKLGLGYKTIKKVNPGIIYAACSGFGQTGPYAQRGAYDVIIQGMAGTLSITGEPGGSPVRVGFSVADLGAGLFTALGILAALHERKNSGEGQMIDVAMLDTQVALLENAFSRYFATGEVPGPLGTRHPVVTPFQAFPSQDGYVVLAVSKKDQWERFMKAIGREDLLQDERFKTSDLRTQHRDALEEILTSIMKSKTTDQWVQFLETIRIPAGPVNTIDKIAADPQIQAREMITELDHTGIGKVCVVSSPIKFSRTPSHIERSSPEVGEHTEEVLRTLLNRSEEELAELKREGVI
jgi:CoA:oxalate CoA-transferase